MRGIPQSFFITTDGIVADHLRGIPSAQDLDRTLDKILPVRALGGT